MKKNKENDSKFKDIFKRILAFLGVATTVALPAGIAVEKSKNEKPEETSSEIVENSESWTNQLDFDGKEITKEELDNFRENLKIETSSRSKAEERTSKLGYNELLKELNEVYKEKKFDEKAYKYVKAVFDRVYENYNSYRKMGNSDLPTREDYIENNIIGALRETNSLVFYHEKSEEGLRNEEEGGALGWTDENFNIYSIYNDEEENFDVIVERLAHELSGHINQKKIVFDEDFFKGYEFLQSIVLEGEATNKMKYCNPLKTEKTSADFIEHNDIRLEYKNDNGQGYSKELNIYRNLQRFAGYDAMQKITSGEKGAIEGMKNSIANKYGKSIADDIFIQMKKMYNASIEDNKEDELKASIKLNDAFLECMCKDIENLKTKDEVIRAVNAYRNYKIEMPKLYKNDKDITNSTFDIDRLDNLMINKIKKTNAYKFSSNQKENDEALGSLLYVTNEEFEQIEENYYGIYVPADLDTVKYKMKDGHLRFRYFNSTESITANRDITIMYTVKDGNVYVTEIEDEKGFEKIGEENITR